jgi:type II secretory pathway pseudopilin PulG
MKAFVKQRILLTSTAGFSYVEVLVSAVLIAVTLVPAVTALLGGIRGGSIHAQRAADHYRLTGKLEEVLAMPFEDLQQAADAAGGPGTMVAAYSDSAGIEGRRLVYLSRYDGDNLDSDLDPFTGVDDGLLWVRVQIENTWDMMETLTKK